MVLIVFNRKGGWEKILSAINISRTAAIVTKIEMKKVVEFKSNGKIVFGIEQ